MKQLRFSGQLSWSDALEQEWTFHLSKGSIMYATGGIHSMRRWRRNLAVHCPRLPTHRLGWQADLASAGASTSSIGWEYTLLNLWVAKQRITPEQATNVVLSTLVEVLFDVKQAASESKQIKHEQLSSTQVGLAQVEDVIAKTQWRWQAWQDAKLTAYSPNQAPIIKQPEQLREHCSAQFYQMLVQRLNGQHTLYDLAVQMQRDVMEVTASLLPFIQVGWVELITIADLSALIYPRRLSQAKPAAAPKALIACVDDSALVRNTMETLLTSAGYQFLGVDNALRAISILLARKPDLIFLDLVMPEANGYEVCEQLRKLSCFRNTPIVILTGNDGYSNRLRANFVKASGFLSKPLNAEAVLSEIRKHLEQGATNLTAPAR
ncbi:response regulator [Stenomitos frigidus]|uniref:response regulator n=1 Tax=Stenomitos frigidus TaxID=1886765 RepID=UPI0030DCED58